MKDLKVLSAIAFLLIWGLVILLFIGRTTNHTKNIKPHLEVHASAVSSLFYQTCIQSKLNSETLNQMALISGMTAGTSTDAPLDSFGAQEVLLSWEAPSTQSVIENSKYKPFPNQLWLFRVESETTNDRFIIKRRCQLDFHHGVMRSSKRPYYIERRGFHDEYRELLGSEIIKELEKNGAEIIDAVTLYKDPRTAVDPIVFKLEGRTYHLRVRPFSFSLEFA